MHPATTADFDTVIEALTEMQRAALLPLAKALLNPVEVVASPQTDFATPEFCGGLANTLLLHHAVSRESFTKDKFEHALVNIFTAIGRDAELAPRGNPGYDILVDEERWSLKTQADSGIRADTLHISKFMELGQGRWVDEADLHDLRDRMLAHLNGYQRVFSLRCLSAARGFKSPWIEYELVEIPKSLLQLAANGEIMMMHGSVQNPKPGYCTVREGNTILFQLYFDGGSERKLQIKGLLKARCQVHARFQIHRPQQ